MGKSASKKSTRSLRKGKEHEPARDEFGLLWCKEEFRELTYRFEPGEFAKFTLRQRVSFLETDSLRYRETAQWLAKHFGRDDVETVFAELAGGSGGDKAQRKIDATMDSDEWYNRESFKDSETDPNVLFDALGYWFHPASYMYPFISGDEMQEVMSDIERNGQVVPILRHPESGQIIDGRNRFVICLLKGKEPNFKYWDGKGSLVDLVRSLNEERRHLTTGQKAIAALRAKPLYEREAEARMKAGKKPDPAAKMQQGRAADLAAKGARVSATYVRRMEKILKIRPDFEAEFRSPEMTIPKAERVINEAVRAKAREINRKIIAKVPLLEAFRKGVKFSTIVADPPWDYLDGGGQAAPKYQTMSLDEIKALAVPEKAADDCHLYLWAPNALLFSKKEDVLSDVQEVLNAWGFKYAQTLTWCKPDGLPTAWFFSRTEFVIFAVRGSQPFKQRAAHDTDGPNSLPTFFDFKPGQGHSAKPEEFITQIVERCSPGPYLEMFGRAERRGWSVWGEPAAKRKPAPTKPKRKRAA